jgi:hypothetical protein
MIDRTLLLRLMFLLPLLVFFVPKSEHADCELCSQETVARSARAKMPAQPRKLSRPNSAVPNNQK